MCAGTSCVIQQNLSAIPKFTPTNEANRKIITSLFISMALLLRAGTSVPGSCIDVASVYSFKASSYASIALCLALSANVLVWL